MNYNDEMKKLFDNFGIEYKYNEFLEKEKASTTDFIELSNSIKIKADYNDNVHIMSQIKSN